MYYQCIPESMNKHIPEQFVMQKQSSGGAINMADNIINSDKPRISITSQGSGMSSDPNSHMHIPKIG